jgi:phosphoribosyl-AMP cyclohydrolase
MDIRLNKNLRYISDYDELTWLINVDDFRFYECSIPWVSRKRIRQWVEENCSGQVFVWNGLLAPDKGAVGDWGSLVSPDGKTCFFVFMEETDETRFALEFTDTDLCKTIHSTGTKAYYSRKNKY